MTSLQVGHVTLTMGQGGIENLILSLGETLSGEKTTCSVYCLDDGGELLETVERMGMRTVVFKRRNGLDWGLIAALAKKFRADRLHVVHTHNVAAHFYGCMAARLARVPVVINTEHSRHYIDGHWRRRVEKWLLSHLSDRLVAVSEELRRSSLELDRINPDKVMVISNGIDVRKFSAVSVDDALCLRAREEIAPHIRVITIIARLHPVKNHQLLFRALSILKISHPDICLLVVGDGAQKEALVGLTVELGLVKSVRFLGNRHDIPVILKASDLLVLCSTTEGLPLTLLEAMAARVPVVVTSGSNRCGLIKHGVTGIACGDNPEELANAILEQLAANPEQAPMTAAAYSLVEQNYSREQMGSEYETLYRQCLPSYC